MSLERIGDVLYRRSPLIVKEGFKIVEIIVSFKKPFGNGTTTKIEGFKPLSLTQDLFV